MPIDQITRFARDEEGGAAIFVSLSLTILIGFVALGVDVASLYRDRAHLQAVSDLTAVGAMARSDTAQARATLVMARNGASPEALETLQTGRFLRNPELAAQDRFTALPAGSAGVNAVRVVLEEDAALHFSRIFTEETHISLNRTALATRTGAASFSLDSHLVHLHGVDLNGALTQSFGASAAINLGAMQALAEVEINLGALLAALDALSGRTARNPAEVLNATTTGADLVAALQTILPGNLAPALGGLGDAAGSSSFQVATLVGGIDTDLGLTATDFLSEIEIAALDVIRALVSGGNVGDHIDLNVDVDVAGILDVQNELIADEPPAESGWIALGEEGVQLHRAALRMKTDITVQPDLLGSLGAGVQIAQINVPLYTELAGSSATLEQLSCSVTAPQGIAARFSTAQTPLHPTNGTSVAALYLGALPDGPGPVDPADLGFADLVTVNIVIALPLLPDLVISGLTIQGRSHVRIGSAQTDTVSFTHAEVAAGATIKTYGSQALISTAVSDLLASSNTELRVKPGQSGLVSGLAAPVVDNLLTLLPAQLLSALAGPVDAVLDAGLAAAGVQVGAGELTLTGHHCEPIRLVR